MSNFLAQYFCLSPQVFPLPVVLVDLGHAVRCGSFHGYAAWCLQSFLGQHLGAFRCRLPGQLHCQPSRLHDHQRGILRPFWNSGLEGGFQVKFWHSWNYHTETRTGHRFVHACTLVPIFPCLYTCTYLLVLLAKAKITWNWLTSMLFYLK